MSILKLNVGSVEMKRFYFDDIFTVECPKCEMPVEFDGRSDYLSYPEIGDSLDMYCQECEHEWAPYKLKSITMELETV